MNGSPDKAMVLAAGLGTRMRPLTDHMPKPLVRVGGKTLLDWGLDALGDAGVGEAVVNVHYFPDMLVEHVASRQTPAITISDERDQLLDSAGGIVKSLSFFGGEPFFILNADTFWIDRESSNLERLASFWDGERMDILLMLADPQIATGHTGKLDFVMEDGGALQRARGADDGFIYAGVAILHPRIFEGASPEPHSLNLYFDRAIAAGRLFGLPLDGHWLTVGTPDAIEPAEDVLGKVSKAS